MNFSPFGSHFSTSIPNIHQFAAKLSQDVSSATAASFATSPEDISLTNRYTANGIPSFTQHHHATTAQHQILSSPSSSSVAKPSPNSYLTSQNLYHTQHGPHKRHNFVEQQNFDLFSLRTSPDKTLLTNNSDVKRKDHHESTGKLTHTLQPVSNHLHHQHHHHQGSSSLSSPWPNLPTSTSSVADYLSQFPPNSLPLSLHEFLKYSAETLKKDGTHLPQSPSGGGESSILNNGAAAGISSLHTNGNLSSNNGNNAALTTLTTINTAHLHNNGSPVTKKKKKKKPEKEKKPKPKPGEIRLSTALDGSTLYCCPECHMALPERDLLEQHLMGHNMERRFVCDICGAALKRKDHLTRHKQSHNPERPFICSVCLKAFKRKEQLTLHFVIHSGEKRHVCTECGKGFYRKDHLRKHTRSHIARRVKAELSQQGVGMHPVSS